MMINYYHYRSCNCEQSKAISFLQRPDYLRLNIFIGLLIIFPLLLHSAIAECSEWRFLYSSEGNQHFLDVYEEPYDLTNIIIVRQKTVYDERTAAKVKEARGYIYRDFTESVHVYAINCAEKRWQIKAVYDYDSGNKVIDSLIYKNNELWKLIKPGLPSYMLYKKLCPIDIDNDKKP
jgi:hypothetical protein